MLSIAETDLGTMLVAATGKGICRLSFDEDEAELRRRFPNATIEPGGAAMGCVLSSGTARHSSSAKRRTTCAPCL